MNILGETCPAGKIKCKHYKFYTNEEVRQEVHPSNHKCCAVRYMLYIHDFEQCPFPSRAISKEETLRRKTCG